MRDLPERIAYDPWFYALRVIGWIAVGAVLIALAISAWAAPVAQAQKDGVTITLYDEPCRLDIKLPYRAVWTEGSKTYEGCFDIRSGIVITYWGEDKSIALIPGQAFRPMT